MKPLFITFTGIDERTDLERVRELSAQYPIEWGFLFSEKRQGNDNRYPGMSLLDNLHGLQLSAHICGSYSKQILDGKIPSLDLRLFSRTQVNCINPVIEGIVNFADAYDLQAITQCRSPNFPDDDRVAWLYDCSGGKGTEPDAWPTHPGERLVGYAGGLNPTNVKAQLLRMDTSGPFWIDMESGVRTDDWLDLSKCEAVCKEVFG